MITFLRTLVVGAAVLASGLAMAHPNGTYTIDGDEDISVTFEFVERCPAVPGAMRGGLRTLTFSEGAEVEPYNFVTGYYVEAHTEAGETYFMTDENCVPVEENIAVEASRSTFGGYSLQRQ